MSREFERSNYVLNIIVVCRLGGLFVPVIEISVLLNCRLVLDCIGLEGIEMVVVVFFGHVVQEGRLLRVLCLGWDLLLCCNSIDFCSCFFSRFHSACATSKCTVQV